ncbi:MAG TPA: DUF6600 domain-containing protein [Thermoanaerobaculia bacterium]|nr:DUF6600 domain-containing protein [Thermoanaerobaculia bacterium]
MKARNFVFITVAAVALGWGGGVYAQYPPPPPPGPPPADAYSQQPPGYGDPGYQDQQPYYDPRPDGDYDVSGDDQGYDATDDQGPVDESVFYGDLSPYGRWIQRGSYGWVWEPTQVEVGWRPYTRGHWVMTDYGWTWLSEEPWGWATYHYGRWLLDPQYGWLWVPGTQWGPAWVSFQQGSGYVGWAPLPPSVGFRAGIGIQIGAFNLSVEIDPYAYSFVPERDFLDARVDRVILPPARNVSFVHSTRNITNIRVVNNRVFNQGIPEQHIAEVTGQRVQRYQLNPTRDRVRGRVAQVQGNQVSIFRPGDTLAQPRPSVTPQAVIQRREQQRQRGQQAGQLGQPPRPSREVQPQPDQQPQPGGQPPQRQPRWQQPPPSQADLDRKHQTEQQQLQSRQEAERNRLQQLHEQEAKDAQAQGRARQIEAQHQAEQQALQQQHQREQQLLQARHEREQQAAQTRPPRQNDRNPQNQQQDQQRNRDRQPQREKRPEPTPPPPM